ncbi:MAG: LuxR C-terminal-related transcriptional regulator, partial [Bacteroidia bacterium]|nr:LuxR C-terminal-related transcriptional regulator [Bacteroidia bacterium]
PRKKDELETLVGRINRELKNERFQKLFDETFDQVHDDFLTRLKDLHPELTPRELRLCAFLRMNLSTKEIAPLMNISVRGVEIGRYRLRKKLNLERDENLIDYLIRF